MNALAQSVSILIVTDEREIPRSEFLGMFEHMDGIIWEEVLQPTANEMIEKGEVAKYDVLVFYDMHEEISPLQKDAYIELFEQGKPALFLHHSLVSYQHWDEFVEIRGGRYYDSSRWKGEAPQGGFSTYRHDVDIPVEIAMPDHPVVKGLNDFTIFDEVYGNFYVSEGVTPLLKTSHPESDEVIAWENKYLNSTIIYIQPGHSASVFQDGNYVTLVRNALEYLKSTAADYE